MHFIITGGAGFIGSHVIEKLLAEKHQLTIIDNFATGKFQNLLKSPNVTVLEASVLDCNLTILNHQFDGLIHLAATPSVTQSWLEPLAAHENNVSTTVAVIQLCHDLKIPRLVFASSAAVYGNPAQVPISEDTPTNPISPYGLQKLVSEQYVEMFSKKLGISSVNLRLFNVFGPRQDPCSPYSGVISIFIKAMRTGQPITINGDGTQTRDFVYVKDVASAFAKALMVPLEPGNTLTVNIGTGKAISLMQLKASLQSCFPKWQPNTTLSSPRPGDIQDSQANITKARHYLKFMPEFSIQDGLLDLTESFGS